MNIKDIIKNSLRSLRRSKLRTFLTSFAIFIGVFIIIVLVSLSNGAQKIIIGQITSQFDLKSIFVLQEGSLDSFRLSGTKAEEEKPIERKSLNQQALEDIKALENVEFADPVLNIPGRKFEFVNKEIEQRIINSAEGGAWDIRDNDNIIEEVYIGRFNNLTKEEVVLTKDLLDAYNLSPEKVLGEKITLTDQPSLFGSQTKPIDPRTYTVVGVINPVRNFVYITSLQEGLDTLAEKNNYSSSSEYLNFAGYQSIYVKSNTEQNVKALANNIRKLGYDVTTLEDVLVVFNAIFSFVPILFTVIGGIAIFVASIGIINTMLMSVFERTREIGVLKAVGAKNTDILWLFLTEAGLIGLIGGLIAFIVSSLVIFIGNNIFVNLAPELGLKGVDSLFIADPLFIIVTIVLSILIGMLSGLYPAYRASRLNPVDALRYE